MPTSLNPTIRGSLILSLLEHDLTSFQVSTVRSIFLSHAKQLLVDARYDGPVKQLAGCLAPEEVVPCRKLVQQLPGFLAGQKCLADINDVADLLCASIWTCPEESRELTQYFLQTYSDRTSLLRVDNCVYLCDALARSDEHGTASRQLRLHFAEFLASHLNKLTREQLLKVLFSCCSVGDTASISMLCNSVDKHLLASDTLLDDEQLIWLCRSYRMCEHASSLPIAHLLELHNSRMSDSDTRGVLHYIAENVPGQMTQALLQHLGDNVLRADTNASSILFTLKSMTLFRQYVKLRPPMMHCAKFALEVVQAHVANFAGHHCIQLLEVFVDLGCYDATTFSALIMQGLENPKALQITAVVALLTSISRLTPIPLQVCRVGHTKLGVLHPTVAGYHKTVQWLESMVDMNQFEHVPHLHHLCWSLRTLRLCQASCLLHRLLLYAEMMVQYIHSLHHVDLLIDTVYTLAVLNYQPTRQFLCSNTQPILQKAQEPADIGHGKQAMSEGTVKIVFACQTSLYSTHLSAADKSKLERLLRMAYTMTSFPEVQSLHALYELQAYRVVRDFLPNLYAVLTEQFKRAMVTDRKLASGHPISVVLFVDCDGQPVMKEMFEVADGLVLTQVHSLSSDLFAVPILLLDSSFFGVKTAEPDLVVIDTEKVIGPAVASTAELKALGYVPLLLCIDSFRLLQDTASAGKCLRDLLVSQLTGNQ